MSTIVETPQTSTTSTITASDTKLSGSKRKAPDAPFATPKRNRNSHALVAPLHPIGSTLVSDRNSSRVVFFTVVGHMKSGLPLVKRLPVDIEHSIINAGWSLDVYTPRLTEPTGGVLSTMRCKYTGNIIPSRAAVVTAHELIQWDGAPVRREVNDNA